MTEAKSDPIRVLITGAAGQIGYSLIPLIASGQVFGPQQRVILHLLDVTFAEKALRGVVMEIEDAAYPLLAGVVPTTNLEVACKGVRAAFLVGGMPRRPGMTRQDLLSANAAIFIGQGKALSDHADANCKVLVVANPANTNALIALTHATKLPATNFSCLTRLDHNRAIGQLASKLGVAARQVRNAVIWGNHSNTMFPDATRALVTEANGTEVKVTDRLAEAYYRGDEFLKTVANRGAAILETRGLSSALSAAKASCDHMRDWIRGTAPGEIVSMGVISTGNSYGVADGLVYSFPVTCANGTWTIVPGLAIDAYSRAALTATEAELAQEKKDAAAFLDPNNIPAPAPAPAAAAAPVAAAPAVGAAAKVAA